HDPREAVARREGPAGLMPSGPLREPLDLGDRDATPVRGVALGLQLPGALPATERVRADADGAGGVSQGQAGGHVPKHCIGRCPRDQPWCLPSPVLIWMTRPLLKMNVVNGFIRPAWRPQ